MLWLWLCDRVDNAGVVDVCWPICNAETGIQLNDDSMRALGEKVEKLENGKWWIPGFTKFQFGELSDDPRHKVHASVIKLLKNHSLCHRVSHRLSHSLPHTPKEKEKDKDKEKDKETVDQSTLNAAALALKKTRPRKPTYAPDGSIAYTPDFLKTWAIYPNKANKLKAFEAWNKLPNDPVLHSMILKAIQIQVKWPQWTKEEGKYIPHLSSWLNQMRWEDEGVGKIESNKQRPGPEELERLGYGNQPS